MAVKEKINPCAQVGACVKTPSGLRAYVLGPDPQDADRVLIEYEAKSLGTDWYPPRSLTLVQAAPEAPPPQPEPAIDEAAQLDRNLGLSLHNLAGAKERWQKRRQTGLTDAQLKQAIAEEFGIAGGGARGGDYRAHKVDQGQPKFWNQCYAPKGKPTLAGTALVDKVRELLEIPQGASDNLAALRTRANRRADKIQRTSLAALASEINQLHLECEGALTVAKSAETSALQHAKLCGEKLLAAKQACGHGNWETWRSANLQVPSSTATLYQRVAERWSELEQSSTVLTLKDAATLLRKPRQAALKQSEEVTAASAPIARHPDPPTQGMRSVNSRECLFNLGGMAVRGQISSVLIDWQTLSVKAMVIDHDLGQTQVPASQVQIFQEEPK